jgi:teichuronic acid biosynthesis glycosyltransferase TuaG
MQLVSIIIPYFKKKNYFLSCINSILNQEYSSFEVIIIDDECSKESKLYLESIRNLDKKKRIKIIYNKFNIGAGRSRNIGIKKSKGKYIAFIDADDQWHKYKLKKQILFMKKKNILISHTSYSIVDYKNKTIGFNKAESKINYKELIN